MPRPKPHSAPYKLTSPHPPAGDQPAAIASLSKLITAGERYATLLGITGSGKTYTMASVIAELQKPALILAPNKTLAAQLYAEFRQLFPENRVRYFVSYYDYYQPEAYVPSTNTYIEKDAAINEEIDKLRHSATKALLEARDVIIVASISCIYGLGAPEQYFEMMLFLEAGQRIPRSEILRKLVTMQYVRADFEFKRGSFRVRGDTIDIFPSHEDKTAYRLVLLGNTLEELREIDPITGNTVSKPLSCAIYPTSHFVSDKAAIDRAVVTIAVELEEQRKRLEQAGKADEAFRLTNRVRYDLELLKEIGFCSGIENYSRHIAGRAAGEPPTTLIDYFPKDFLLFIDESHVTLPQLGAMSRGDRARKTTLVEYGFRLPSAIDNRPLTADEFWNRVGQTVFVSATPSEFELERSGSNIVEQIIRPTGLLDPVVTVRPASSQIEDLLSEIKKVVANKDKVLVLTLTKKMAENLTEYMCEANLRVRYIHSDVDTLERIELLQGLSADKFDILVGINLLREGIDLPSVALVAILDADKEGFLRSTVALIQIVGRAARNLNGHVILYGDSVTDSMKRAMEETERRRQLQQEHNVRTGTIPKSVAPKVITPFLGVITDGGIEIELNGTKIALPSDRAAQVRLIEELRKNMYEAAARRQYEVAATIRDQINIIQQELLKI